MSEKKPPILTDEEKCCFCWRKVIKGFVQTDRGKAHQICVISAKNNEQFRPYHIYKESTSLSELIGSSRRISLGFDKHIYADEKGEYVYVPDLDSNIKDFIKKLDNTRKEVKDG